MAGKRTATSDLNHENWNREEEPEERGSFLKASEHALKNRIIKTARRRNPIRSEDSESTRAFEGFSGFSSKPADADFSFLKNVIKPPDVTKTNGIGNTDTSKSVSGSVFTKPTMGSIFGGTATTSSTSLFGSSTTSTSNSIVPTASIGTKKSEKYWSRLKGLNESVSKWIAKKVEENPLISLQPIFKDYDKYLDDIEKEESEKPANALIAAFNVAPSEGNKAKNAMPDSALENKETATVPTFKFGASSTAATSTAPTFTFGSASNAVGEAKSFSFGATTTSLTPSMSFGSSNTSTGFTFKPSSAASVFGDGSKTDTDKPKENDEDAEDEPPKVEFKAVVESDSVYTTRCKVFVKKEANFGDRGVGNLYLKPIENSDKFQLIVRADTNLGNLLLNFILSESVPTKRLGKKDVMLVAIPTPDAQPPPTPLLLRVKTPEDADKLLEVLEKHKK